MTNLLTSPKQGSWRPQCWIFLSPQVATEGVHVKNAARDLGKKWLQASEDWPQPYMVELPFEHGLEEITFLLPHELVQLQVKEKVPWKLEPGTPLHDWIGKVLAEKSESIKEMVPLTLWGDGVPYSKTDSLMQV